MSSVNLTFERSLNEWEIIHPRQLTTENISAFISSQTTRIVEAQLEVADRIIVSQERITSGIDKVVFGIDRFAEGLESLASAFEWGFSEVVWQLEQQRTILEDILKVLQAPLDTQAKELKKRAEEAYRYGWFDDALQDFLESEKKNRYDFTIHQYLGNIFLFEKKNSEKALNYYEKAVKYAFPKSPYHASFALLHISLIKYLQEDFQKAYESTSKALELSPNFYEVHYQHAQYCVKLGKYDEAIEHLRKAINGDRYYCVKADLEKNFEVMKKRLRSFFKELKDKAQSQARKDIEIAGELIKDAESYGISIDISDKLKSAKRKLKEARIFFKRRSLFDCWDACYKALVAQKMAVDSSEEHLQNQYKKIETEYNLNVSKCRGKAEDWRKNIIPVLQWFVFPVPSILFSRLIWLLTGEWVSFIIGFFVSWLGLTAISHFIIKVVKESTLKKYKETYDKKIAGPKHNLSELKTKWKQVTWYLEELQNIEDVDQCEEIIRKIYG